MNTATKRRTAPSAVQTKRAEKQEEVAKKAMTYFARNSDMNKAKNEAAKARSEAYQLYKAAKLKPFEVLVGNMTYDVAVESKTQNVVDVHKLRKLVTDDEFMQIVSASAKAVESIVGKAILKQVTVSEPCDENLYVTPKKETKR